MGHRTQGKFPGADQTWDAKFPVAGCQWQMNAYRDPLVEM